MPTLEEQLQQITDTLASMVSNLDNRVKYLEQQAKDIRATIGYDRDEDEVKG